MRRFTAVLFLSLALLLSAGCRMQPQAPSQAPPALEQPSPAPSDPAPPDEAPPPLSRDFEVQLTLAYPQLSFVRPLEYRTAGDGGENIFVVEKGGRILVFPNTADADSAEIFLDLSGLVDSSSYEKGLLGMAFHPDYQDNGFFYVNYTAQNRTFVARYQTERGHPDRAAADSGVIILSFAQPYDNHNGGQIEFGPDGYLYIATGDGGLAGDPQNNAQNLGNLLGKILRIDVDNPDEERPYGIPGDNPFAQNTQGHREEIYAYGLRNPWKFSFDPQRGWLWAADVGQDRVEEINLIERGGNYGWNRMEGSLGYPRPEQYDPEGLVLPVWEYEHPVGNSITGGYVYYGEAIPALRGAYVYGDFGTGALWALWLDDGMTPDNRLLLQTDLRISSLGLDGDNELYVVDYQGGIYKITQP
jgi:glucose/arabinose dehydrogenase